jgi:hypothetical protein
MLDYSTTFFMMNMVMRMRGAPRVVMPMFFAARLN